MAQGELDKQCSMAELQHLLAHREQQVVAAARVITDQEAEAQDLKAQMEDLKRQIAEQVRAG